MIRRHVINAPGRNGLITERVYEQPDQLAWGLTLENAEISLEGLIGVRKGWDLEATEASQAFLRMHEFILDKDTSHIIFSTATDIWDNPASPSDGDFSGGTVPSAGYWQFANFNGYCVCAQESQTMQYWDGTRGSGKALWKDLAAINAPTTGHSLLSAWGRLWVTDSTETIVYWSQLLMDITSASGDWSGTGAGSINTLHVWPDGLDRVTALAQMHNRLLIFGTRSILVYTGVEDPGNDLALEDVIRSGTQFRDSVVEANDDVLYLADDGVRSVRRGLESDILPMTNLSTQVHQQLTTEIRGVIADPNSVAAEYNVADDVYYLKTGLTITRSPLEYLVPRNGWWHFGFAQLTPGSNPKASKPRGFMADWDDLLWSSVDQKMYGINGDDIYSQSFTDYDDAGADIPFRWRSSWIEIAQGQSLTYKEVVLTVATLRNFNIQLSWGTNFSAFNDHDSLTKLISDDDIADAVIGTDHRQLHRVRFPISGSGSSLALSIDVDVDGSAFAIQQIAILYVGGSSHVTNDDSEVIA